MKLYAKVLLWALMSTFLVAGATAQIYEPGKTLPVLGQVQDGGITGCVELTDTYQMVEANITGQDAKSVWLGLLQEGKCGTFNLPFFYQTILGEFDIGHKTAYVVEVKVQLNEWASIYAFVPFKPSGVQLIHDTPHYVQAPADWQKWFGEALTTLESRPRLAAQGFVWHSCCNRADRVKAQFRVSANKPYSDEWHYLDPTTNQWVRIPNDIIHYEDDPKMPTQLKVEGVLFVYNGIPTCFWAPQEGG